MQLAECVEGKGSTPSHVDSQLRKLTVTKANFVVLYSWMMSLNVFSGQSGEGNGTR